jgi:hypothetical protein
LVKLLFYYPPGENRKPQAYVESRKPGELFVNDLQHRLNYPVKPTNNNRTSLPQLINAFERDYTKETGRAFVQFEPGKKEFPVLKPTDLSALLHLLPDDFRKTKK